MKRVESREISVNMIFPWAKAEKLFPEYSNEEYDDLESFVKLRGQFNPIYVNESFEIIDGYNRWRLAKKIGLKQIQIDIFAYSSDSEMEDHAIVCNAKGRELDVYTKKRVFERLLELRKPTKEQTRQKQSEASKAQPREGNRFSGLTSTDAIPDRPERVAEKAAKEVGISVNTAKKIESVKKAVNPEVFKEIEKKVIPVKQAVEISKLPEEKQVQIVNSNNWKEDFKKEVLDAARMKPDKEDVPKAGSNTDLLIASFIDCHLKLDQGLKHFKPKQLTKEELIRAKSAILNLFNKLQTIANTLKEMESKWADLENLELASGN